MSPQKRGQDVFSKGVGAHAVEINEASFTFCEHQDGFARSARETCVQVVL